MTEGKDQNGGQDEEKSEQEGPPPPKQPIKEESVETTPEEFSVEAEAIETSESTRDAGQSIPNRDN